MGMGMGMWRMVGLTPSQIDVWDDDDDDEVEWRRD